MNTHMSMSVYLLSDKDEDKIKILCPLSVCISMMLIFFLWD